MKYAILVVGPAGCGKSTFCHYMREHYEMLKRPAYCINFDPACEDFKYEPIIDIRDLISLDDVTDPAENLRLGPNGGLVYCMEFFSKNMEWLDEVLSESTGEDDVIFIDCPGQIELYTHLDVFSLIIKKFEYHNFKIATVFCLDAQFLTDCDKFMGGVLAALSCMVKIELPHLNVMTKIGLIIKIRRYFFVFYLFLYNDFMDLLSSQAKEKIQAFLDPYQYRLIERGEKNKKHEDRLKNMLFRVIEDYSMVKFHALDRTDEDSLAEITHSLDMALQFGEEEEVNTKEFEQPDQEVS